MECESCGVLLDDAPGLRPVSLCRHVICETCAASDMRCPICSTSIHTEVVPVHRHLLDVVIAVRSSGAASLKFKLDSSSRGPVFRCHNHQTGRPSIEFCCFQDKQLLCAQCGYNHIKQGHDVSPYSFTAFFMDVSLMLRHIESSQRDSEHFKRDLVNCLVGDMDVITASKLNLVEVLKNSYKFVQQFTSPLDLDGCAFAKVYGLNIAKNPEKSIDSKIFSAEKYLYAMFGLFGEEKILKLTYRGVRDGFSARIFHKKCDGSSPTLTVIKVPGDKIIGAFTTAAWTSDGNHVSGSQSDFMFSLNPVIRLDCAKPKYSILSIAYLGPTFGKGDINIANNCDVNISSAHPGKVFGRRCEQSKLDFFGNLGDFIVEDLEVFVVGN